MYSANQAIKNLSIDTWFPVLESGVQQEVLQDLEYGKLLLLPRLNFTLSREELPYLSPIFVNTGVKNISYSPSTAQLKGAVGTQKDLHTIQNFMARFAEYAQHLIEALFPHYKGQLRQARTSFRPVQVSQRKQSYRKDDRRLHVDAFPASPNQGQRILRVFSNINPQGEDRVWRIGEAFEKVANRFVPQIPRPFPGSAWMLQTCKITKTRRTEYDHFMLQIHDRMKKDLQYQDQAEQTELRLPAGSSWIVQTDQVSHAALSGQHMLEQTFYLPVEAMLDSEKSPLRILERILKKKLVLF